MGHDMRETTINTGEIVTLDFGDLPISNTYIVDSVEDKTLLLSHPLSPDILIRVPKNSVNKVVAQVKDSSERMLDFVRSNSQYLGYRQKADLEALALYYVVHRKLSDNQKKTLSNMTGIIASIHFNNDIQLAMKYIQNHEGLLDDFNSLWYNNFSKLFTGEKRLKSSKQRAALFNIAGFVLAELATPSTSKN